MNYINEMIEEAVKEGVLTYSEAIECKVYCLTAVNDGA